MRTTGSVYRGPWGISINRRIATMWGKSLRVLRVVEGLMDSQPDDGFFEACEELKGQGRLGGDLCVLHGRIGRELVSMRRHLRSYQLSLIKHDSVS